MTESTCTERELEARRANARKSTGPSSVAGKERVRLNALKHGGYATDEVFADTLKALGEDPAQFDALLASLMEAREPADAVESLLVEEIAHIYWKKRRLERLEESLQMSQLEKYDEVQGRIKPMLELEARKLEAEFGVDLSDQPRESKAARIAAMALPTDQWSLLVRQQNGLDRQLDRKMRLLERIQNDRRKRERQLAAEQAAEHAPVTEQSEEVVENTGSAIGEAPFLMAPVSMTPVVLPSRMAAMAAGIVQPVS